MNYLRELYRLKNYTIKQVKKAAEEKKQKDWQGAHDALCWAINRLDPKIPYWKRIPANQRHYRNTKTYSITMSPEDHDRLIQLGEELHISGGFSGVLTYIAQNCVLIHEKE